MLDDWRVIVAIFLIGCFVVAFLLGLVLRHNPFAIAAILALSIATVNGMWLILACPPDNSTCSNAAAVGGIFIVGFTYLPLALGTFLGQAIRRRVRDGAGD